MMVRCSLAETTAGLCQDELRLFIKQCGGGSQKQAWGGRLAWCLLLSWIHHLRPGPLDSLASGLFVWSAYIPCGAREDVRKAGEVNLPQLDLGMGAKTWAVRDGGGGREVKNRLGWARILEVCNISSKNHPEGGNKAVIKVERHVEEKSGHRFWERRKRWETKSGAGEKIDEIV